jgi:small subunit ribosomal protein S1
VTGVVTGKDGKQAGLELEVAAHRAFMPASQIAPERIEDLSIFVGEKMKCTVSRVERSGKGNIVLSRRDIIDAERKENAAKLKDSLQEGQTVEGTVRKIMPFGAFVDIGGVDGLVHISDLTYDRVGFGEKAVAKFVQEGQKVIVRILKLDWENNRISLGLKQTMSDPFATAVNAITEGAEATGKITKILEFGAFVELGPGVEGLVHISELDHRRVAKVDDVVKPDEIVRVKVLKIDQANRRISLSIKALKPLPELSIGGGGEGGGGKPGRGGGKGKGKDFGGRSAEEILKETPALRRMREKARNMKFKGGIA